MFENMIESIQKCRHHALQIRCSPSGGKKKRLYSSSKRFEDKGYG